MLASRRSNTTPSSSKCIALLLGGTYCPDEKDTYEKSTQVSSDFRSLKRAFKAADVNVIGEIPFREFSEKRECVAALESFFENTADAFLVYWSGHGDLDTGDWRFSDERRLCLKELLRLWKKTQRRLPSATLICISDCCSSGAWCFQLMESTRNRRNPPRVVIQSASMSKEKAYFSEEGSHLTSKLTKLMMHPDDPWACWAHYYQRPLVVSSGVTLKSVLENDTDSRFETVHTCSSQRSDKDILREIVECTSRERAPEMHRSHGKAKEQLSCGSGITI